MSSTLFTLNKHDKSVVHTDDDSYRCKNFYYDNTTFCHQSTGSDGSSYKSHNKTSISQENLKRPFDIINTQSELIDLQKFFNKL